MLIFHVKCIRKKELELHIKLRGCIIVKILISVLLSLAVSHNIIAEAAPDNNVHLVLDSLDYNDIIPKEFHKTIDLEGIKDNKNLNLTGLDKLNIFILE